MKEIKLFGVIGYYELLVVDESFIKALNGITNDVIAMELGTWFEEIEEELANNKNHPLYSNLKAVVRQIKDETFIRRRKHTIKGEMEKTGYLETLRSMQLDGILDDYTDSEIDERYLTVLDYIFANMQFITDEMQARTKKDYENFMEAVTKLYSLSLFQLEMNRFLMEFNFEMPTTKTVRELEKTKTVLYDVKQRDRKTRLSFIIQRRYAFEMMYNCLKTRKLYRSKGLQLAYIEDYLL